jgi:NIMA (never in mitosis gene a)-related kinase
MEFADDGDLYQKIVEYKKQGELFDEKDIWLTLIQVTRALKSLHAANILHRDLKVHRRIKFRALTSSSTKIK